MLLKTETLGSSQSIGESDLQCTGVGGGKVRVGRHREAQAGSYEPELGEFKRRVQLPDR